MSSSDNKERYLAAYQEARWRAAARTPAWLDKLRESAIANFKTLGFPTLKNEDWKYTNVEPITAQQYVSANGEGKQVSAGDFMARSLIDPGATRLVFINGLFRPDLSQTAMLGREIVVTTLSDFIETDEARAAASLGHYASADGESFVALNNAFFDDGAVVVIGPGCRAEGPIYLAFVSTAMAGAPVMSHPRTLILLGAGSEAKIVEDYLGVGGGYFCNAVTELVGAADAMVEHYRLQQEGDAAFHIGTLAARLEQGCQLTAHAVTLSGALVRNHVHVTLAGAGAGCVLNGLYLGDGRQHIDNFTEIEHVQPRASSLELYKGILSGSAHGVFNGKIVVHKDAQKSDARQTNKNLLLSENAVVNTKPQLEIYADDVKCSHGSTIGHMDGDALFYLRSRGLGIQEARSLLSFAFASDVVGRMKIGGLRERLDDYLTARFGGIGMIS